MTWAKIYCFGWGRGNWSKLFCHRGKDEESFTQNSGKILCSLGKNISKSICLWNRGRKCSWAQDHINIPNTGQLLLGKGQETPVQDQRQIQDRVSLSLWGWPEVPGSFIPEAQIYSACLRLTMDQVTRGHAMPPWGSQSKITSQQ